MTGILVQVKQIISFDNKIRTDEKEGKPSCRYRSMFRKEGHGQKGFPTFRNYQ